jgi:hypothetical protein
LWNRFYQDDLKAPLNNQPKMASVSKASMNFYFGKNLAANKQDATIQRTAYAVGSGTSSIGLDPSTMRVHGIFAELSELMELAHHVVKKDPVFAPTMVGHQFNFCSVKLYFAYETECGKTVWKNTEWHLDISHNNNTQQPISTNSQVPGTPVIIATFGDTKELEFRRHLANGLHQNKTKLLFQQHNASIFGLHPDDEKVDPYTGTHWRHKSEMQKKRNNVTFAYMFRVVQRQVWVKAHDSTLANPHVGKRKEKAFRKAKAKKKTSVYKKNEKTLKNNMESILDRFKVK